MDDPEGKRAVKPHQRVDQFMQSHYSHGVGILAANNIANDSPFIGLCFISFEKNTAKLFSKSLSTMWMVTLSTSDVADLCLLLQPDPNAPVTGQRCSSLSLCSAGRNHHGIRDPRRDSSPLCAGLSFRYTQDKVFGTHSRIQIRTLPERVMF
jgi:hypothetical protein